MASPSSVHRTSPKDPIWPSWRRLDLTSRGRLEMTSRRGPNLMFKGRPWQVDLGRPQDVIRTSYRGHSKHFLATMWDYQLDISNFFFFFYFFCGAYSIDQISLKAIQHSRCSENLFELLWWRIFPEIS